MRTKRTKEYGRLGVVKHRANKGEIQLDTRVQKLIDEWDAHIENRHIDVARKRGRTKEETEAHQENRKRDREAVSTEKSAEAERARERKRKQRKRRDELIRSAKEQPCAYCGGSFSICAMDFHHVRGEKVANISELRGHSLKKVEEEIAKCDVICSNCHRKEHCPDST